MAECLSPGPVPVSKFFKIYVPSETVADEILGMIEGLSLELEVGVNRGMFL
ncbi:hypothetical protein X989_2205 [Burkholderia pseudomallei MSHR4378]|nr:hypothetical protein X989_2205 [Burkholderia pseudomallei MSHR4378]